MGIVRNVVLTSSGKPGVFGVPKPNFKLQDNGTERLNPITRGAYSKTGTNGIPTRCASTSCIVSVT